MVPRALSDLSVAKNSTRGVAECAIFNSGYLIEVDPDLWLPLLYTDKTLN